MTICFKTRVRGSLATLIISVTGLLLVSTHVANSNPADEIQSGQANDALLFFDDFEQGWGRWDYPQNNTQFLRLENDKVKAHSGNHYLRSTVSESDLVEKNHISSSTMVAFPQPVDSFFMRLYARFEDTAPNPHHWIRVSASDGKWNSSGLANTVPPGDQGFWFDLDIDNDNRLNFYVYWHDMRSGRCNDGSAVPGCAGDQRLTYHYGNTFRPQNQKPIERNQWTCIEFMAKANTVDKNDGELALWVNDELLEHFRPGNPLGTWLRDSFHPGGCQYTACTSPKAFEGFNFRTSGMVKFNRVYLDAYYQLDSYLRKQSALVKKGLQPVKDQSILYDDVVVSTKRIGCKNQQGEY